MIKLFRKSLLATVKTRDGEAKTGREKSHMKAGKRKKKEALIM